MYRPTFDELETASKDDLLKIIKATKQKMGRLRKVMEHPDYKNKKKVCPSDLVIYKCDRDFLKDAILRYVSLGGKYELSGTEISDLNFNNKINAITKITLKKGSFLDFYCQTEVDLTSEKVKIFCDGIEFLLPQDVDYDRQSFLKEFEDLHVGEWRKFYDTRRYGILVLDGKEWTLTIQYNDGSKKEYAGINAYPYNFKELLKLLIIN